MLLLYNILLFPLRLVAPLVAWWLGRRDPEQWRQRLARNTPPPAPGCLWLHGASAGEVRILRALVEGLRRRLPELPLAVSAYTSTGRRLLPAPPDVHAAFFVPLDFAGLPSRVLTGLQPAALILVETELWPNLLHEARRAGVPVVIVNGRLSTVRMRRYRRLSALYSPLLRDIRRVGAQSEADGERFTELGLPESALILTGNLKYDLAPPKRAPGELRSWLGLDDRRPVFVAGSTGPGEERAALDAFRGARGAFPDLFLVLAPRHPERADEVAQLLVAAELRVARLSENLDRAAETSDVLLLDRVGTLSDLYGLATVAFVGGSLIPVGGHNVLEPAAAGAPVLFGPHTENFADPAGELESAGAARRVADAAGLAVAVEELLGDAEERRRMIARADQVLAANRGALERSLDLIVAALADRRGAA